ncbi:GNAT family N-acetyltransferase [Amycolatopsis sp. cmx-4-68]|uniref:GNAT family N-acetyltransferase n=1 Tax=Amycolatopsis sp. cmx-4-68 TaxID=2790938 RepID=UPI00397C6327
MSGGAGARLSWSDCSICTPTVRVGGVYWVTTRPEHRSKGVGLALMHAVLRHFDDLPVTLTASRAGKALYDKLGFTTLGDAHWWR